MARRSRGGAPEISLFPFLSILACVIGTLTLMITALALGQMDSPAIETAETVEAAQVKLTVDREVIDQLQAQIEQAENEIADKNIDLAQLRDDIERLMAELDKLKNQPPPKADIPLVDVEAHKKRKTELQQEIAALEQQIAQLSQRLKREATPPEAVVQIRPSGSGTNLKPTFVECAASRIIIYLGDGQHAVRRADLATDATFVQLLERIADAQNQTVVFLVRNDGLSTYAAARNLARAKYARNGKLPVMGQGKIDLSLFKKMKGEG